MLMDCITFEFMNHSQPSVGKKFSVLILTLQDKLILVHKYIASLNEAK